MSFNYSPKIVTNGLVLYIDSINIKSYISGSNTCFNLLNPNISASLNNITISTGSINNFSFNGSNSTIDLNIPPSSVGMISGSFTTSTWVYPTDIYVSVGSGGILSADGAASAGNQYSMIVRSGYYSADWYGEAQYAQATVNQWANLVQTYNYITKASTFYLNGVSYGTINRTIDLGANQNLKLGKFGYGGGYFKGNYNSVSIYNRDLSFREVLQNYNTLKSRFGL